MLWRRVTVLKGQQLKLQSKQDLENRSRRNNIRIIGVPRRAEGSDIMAFTVVLIQALRGHDDTSPPLALDKAHRVTSALGHTGRSARHTHKSTLLHGNGGHP
ncbi:hypothetical protein NDU88_002529 [Pleurodeles waltl]|uniref:Uncharacterized protein n=1 Tax=Pleurodeles waltl TaxID=8319 RepID=A0AAV7M0V0_PLEWA|nr:hypothetical protein NDU88_002529 [Pleurodeles waltl]